MTALRRGAQLGRFGSLTIEDAHELTGGLLLATVRDLDGESEEILDRADVEALRDLCEEALR